MKAFLLSLLTLSLTTTAAAQTTPAPPTPPQIVSPEILPDNHVTFRLFAPDATTASVTGDWPGGNQSTTTPMSKDGRGVWSATVGPLTPEFWIYSFSVNGVATIDPSNINTRRDGIQIANTLIVPGPESADYMVNNVPHGTVSLVWYPSQNGGPDRRTYVYTPAGYEKSSQRYPVLYLLHGGSGDEDAWFSCGRATEIFDNLIAQGKARPMVVVMPDGNITRIASPDYVKAPFALPANQDTGRFPRFPDTIVSDLIPFIDKTYRTQADRENRAIAGLSVGGAQTMYTAFNHLDLFAWVAAFSGGYPAMPGVAYDVPLPPNAATLKGPDITKAVDPAKLAALLPQLNAAANARLRLLFISSGTNDSLYPNTHSVLKQLLNDKGVHYTLKEYPGYIHAWPVWRISLKELLPRLFQPAANTQAAN